MPAIINSDSGVITGSAGLKIHGNSDGILEIQNNGVTSLVVANSYIRIPIGNTATRPSVASAGMLRFNNTSNVFETYNGAFWTPLSNQYTFTVEYLVVGGGAGGGSLRGGGGGAGGFLSNTLALASGTGYTVTVGGGGAGCPAGPRLQGSNGTSSSFITPTISSIAFGGGGGGGDSGQKGFDGGSGGGSARGSTAGSGTPGQGSAGGGSSNSAPAYGGGGGGGASQAGTAGSSSAAGKGGDGRPSLITGANVIYAGGGGGASGPGPAGAGGNGGGGPGGSGPNQAGISANTNSGGGGGGAGFPPEAAGGNGGSGIVILVQPNTIPFANVSPGLTYTTNTTVIPGNVIYTFTAGTGTVTWN